DRLRKQERAALAQELDDERIGLEDVDAGPEENVIGELSAGVDRRVDVESIAATGIEIVHAMSRRGVHQASAGVDGHVIAEDEDAFAWKKGVAILEVLERRALEEFDFLDVAPAELLRHGAEQLVGEDVIRPVV